MRLLNDCFVLVNRHIRWVVAFLAIVLIIAFLATMALPTPRQYELRYDLRIRNFSQNTEFPDSILAGVNNIDIESLCRNIDSCYSVLGCVHVFTDKTSRITIRVRHADPDSTYLYAELVRAHLVDTVSRYAEVVHNAKERLYTNALAGLEGMADTACDNDHVGSAYADSLAALRLHYKAALDLLHSDTLSNPDYVLPLNSLDRSDVALTPSRIAVMAMALLAALCLLAAYFFMKALAYRSVSNSKV